MAEFEFVFAIGDKKGADVRLALSGLSTKHGTAQNDRGRLYLYLVAAYDADSAAYALAADIYSEPTREIAGTRVAAARETGTVRGTGTRLALAPTNDSGLSGWIEIEQFPGVADVDSTVAAGPIVLLPTFATDEDVMGSADAAAGLPGFDPTRGLALFHAKAMRQMLTTDLPSKMPHLFGGRGLAAFLPVSQMAPLPELAKVANADALREAQATLVKALAAEDMEHVEEFRAMGAAARERYEALITDLGAANQPAEDKAEAENPSMVDIQFGSFTRG
jgi:hypothetical protein